MYDSLVIKRKAIEKTELTMRRRSQTTIHKAKRNMMSPWPASPNMTANKKGKVIRVNRAAFTSLYLATP